MFDEPPYAERHVRWCEGTGNQIMITFLLDFISKLLMVLFNNDLPGVYAFGDLLPVIRDEGDICFEYLPGLS